MKRKPKSLLKRILRILAIIIAVPLALIILAVAVPFAGSIGLKTEPLPENATTALRRACVGERWMLGAARIMDGLTLIPKDIPEAANGASEHFYPGGESQPGAAWQLGYAQTIITPKDWETKAYYEGGNISVPPRKLTGKLDELKVRVIAISVQPNESAGGPGAAQSRGEVNIFAAVDNLGVTNKQVLEIRALVGDLKLQSVNIAATHSHSAVDGTGFYSKGGVNEDYLAFANERIAEAIRAAVAAMEPGKLYLSQIGQNSMMEYDRKFWEKMDFDDETDEWDDTWSAKWLSVQQEMLRETPIEEYGLGQYIRNRRYPYEAYPSRMTKLRFAPLNEDSKETLLLNFAAHPYVAGLKLKNWPADSISGDFPYYMEEVINEAGANFIYINGAVNGIYPQRQGVPTKSWDEDEDAYYDDYHKTLDWHVRRIGRDYAAVALAMTMPVEEIAKNALTNPDNDHSYEYRNIITVMQNSGTVSETELRPQLSIRLQQTQLALENPLVRWAAKRDKLNANLVRSGKELRLATEIGYMELGGALSVALMPGELTPGLAWGGADTTAEFAFRMRDFDQPSLSESAGRDVLVFGLCNDEVGYVIPDNDYCMFYIPDGGELTYKLLDTWDYEHYAELLSPGPRAAGTLAEAFAKLVQG